MIVPSVIIWQPFLLLASMSKTPLWKFTLEHSVLTVMLEADHVVGHLSLWNVISPHECVCLQDLTSSAVNGWLAPVDAVSLVLLGHNATIHIIQSGRKCVVEIHQFTSNNNTMTSDYGTVCAWLYDPSWHLRASRDSFHQSC